ncbi:MAG: hypothetical protein AAFO86_14005 [Pseudomonadota bacterium]
MRDALDARVGPDAPGARAVQVGLDVQGAQDAPGGRTRQRSMA